MRVEILTFFRFIAAVIVVIFHFGRDATGFSGVLIAGPQMVTFFLVLSGFVMTLSYLNKNDFKAKLYWWARVARIVPVYLLAIALMLLMIYIRGKELNLISLILSLTLLQSWFSSYSLSLNSPTWVISVLVFFYFTFPMILSTVKKYNLTTIKVLVFALSLWGVTQAILSSVLSSEMYKDFPIFFNHLINYFPLSHFCSFLLGVSGGMWFNASKYAIRNIYQSIALAGSAVFLVVFIINNQFQIANYLGFKFAFASSFFAPLFLIFIISISMCQSKVAKILSAKPLVLLGEASYSLYVLQMPIYIIYRYFFAGSLELSLLLDFYLYLVFLILISIFCLIAFERPTYKFIRFSLPKLAEDHLPIAFIRTK